MIFEFLLILFFFLFVVSSLAVSVFHLSQFLGVLPVTDLAILLGVSTNLVRQLISLTFLITSLSGLGLACCIIGVIFSQSSKNRQIELFMLRFGFEARRFEKRRPHNHHYLSKDEVLLPTRLQPYEKHRRNDNIFSFFDVNCC